MFKSRAVLTAVLLVAAIALTTCKDSGGITTPNTPRRTTRSFTVWGDYTNPTRSDPAFQFNADSSDASKVSFASIETAVLESSPPAITITIRNLSLADSAGNYVIDSNDAIKVEEKREGRVWIEDAEFSHSFVGLTKIAVVLVLDVSGSLGSDFSSLKQFAKEFVRIVNQNVPAAQIGLVVFSEQNTAFPLSTDIAAVEKFIDNLNLGANSTALYDAMMRGVGMLDSVVVDGKALVTFTDGADNFSDASSSDVIAKLSTSGIKSFTIGFNGQGNLDSEVLKLLAVSGVSKSAQSIPVLQSVFQRFSREITNVYDVTYTRNDQKIEAPMPVRFTMQGSITTE